MKTKKEFTPGTVYTYLFVHNRNKRDRFQKMAVLNYQLIQSVSEFHRMRMQCEKDESPPPPPPPFVSLPLSPVKLRSVDVVQWHLSDLIFTKSLNELTVYAFCHFLSIHESQWANSTNCVTAQFVGLQIEEISKQTNMCVELRNCHQIPGCMSYG